MTSITDILKTPEKYQDDPLEIRGYLYRNSEGQIILSEIPNLPSCCLMKGSHLLVLGNFPESLPIQPTLIQGTLKNHTLEKAKIISQSSFPYSLLLFLVIPILLLRRHW